MDILSRLSVGAEGVLFFFIIQGTHMQILEVGHCPEKHRDYQLRLTDSGTLELWLYKRGKLWAKKFYMGMDVGAS